MTTLSEMTAEVRAVNIEKGWRAGNNTFGDYIALLHSELSEALEAYRDHRLNDATAKYADEGEHHDRLHGLCSHGELQGDCPTTRQAKPEGVGSELADVLIRLLDMADVYGIHPYDMGCELADVAPLYPYKGGTSETLHVGEDDSSFGSWVAWLHWKASALYGGSDLLPSRNAVFMMPLVLGALVGFCERFGVDLDAEYQRKIAYNRTRPFQHGGRTLNGASA